MRNWIFAKPKRHAAMWRQLSWQTGRNVANCQVLPPIMLDSNRRQIHLGSGCQKSRDDCHNTPAKSSGPRNHWAFLIARGMELQRRRQYSVSYIELAHKTNGGGPEKKTLPSVHGKHTSQDHFISMNDPSVQKNNWVHSNISSKQDLQWPMQILLARVSYIYFKLFLLYIYIYQSTFQTCM